MKTLKITLALVAITILTVSGVQSDKAVNDQPTYQENSTHIDLLAHKKNKLKKPTHG